MTRTTRETATRNNPQPDQDQHRKHNTTTQDQQPTQKTQHNYTQTKRPTQETTTQLHTDQQDQHRNHNTTTQDQDQHRKHNTTTQDQDQHRNHNTTTQEPNADQCITILRGRHHALRAGAQDQIKIKPGSEPCPSGCRIGEVCPC